jgi:hypothetical protein
MSSCKFTDYDVYLKSKQHENIMFVLMGQRRYRDIKLFLWLIPFANLINYYLTYNNITPWKFVLSFTIDTIQGYIAWLITRAIIIWLDKKLPYEKNPARRIGIQLVLTLFAGISSIILLTKLENWIAGHGPVPISFYTKDLFIISIWFFVVNGIYIGLHYYQKLLDSEEQRKKENEIKTGGFKVSTARKDLLLTFEEIGGFYIDGDYSVVFTTDSKKFLVDSSLDKVEKTLPIPLFFRLNRQYIIHRQFVNGYEKGENGKINVLLKDHDHLPSTIPVSRTKAPDFKAWFVAPV